MSRKKRQSRRKRFLLSLERAAEDFLKHIVEEKPRVLLFIPLILIVWAIERWLFSLASWIPLALAVWATRQYGIYQCKLLVEELNSKWKRVALNTLPITPLEPCEWLNKLLTEVWFNYYNPKLSRRLSAIFEKRLKLRKPGLIERFELQEFSLGTCPPSLGLQGIRWSTSGDQRVMQMGLDWDTNEMSILMLVKLAKPLMGTTRIVINSLHIKGDLLFIPILDGKALLYSFASTPEVRIGVAFGSGGSQSLPATVLPGVSSWLVKLFTETIFKTMVEPRRRCLYLPVVDFRRKAVGGIVHVTVISANKLSRSCFKGRQQDGSSNGPLDAKSDEKDLQTFVEVELEELTRRTDVRLGSTPRWDAAFNMVLHDSTGTLRFNLYECPPNSVKYDYLGTCEIKMRHVEDDSTVIWAIGPDSGIIAKHAECSGEEVEVAVPFEGVNSGELKVRIVVKEWQFSDGSHSLNNFRLNSQHSLNGSSPLLPRTGRKLNITVVEGKNLSAKDKSGKFEPYIKLQYGKNVQRTRTSHTSSPFWNHKFEFDEISGGEHLRLKCFSDEIFGDENIGSAIVSLEGLVERKIRDVWIPLERVNSGEIRLQLSVMVDDNKGTKGSDLDSENGWIELDLLEARDLIGADLRGTSDPYVRVNYGQLKKKTKVIHKTLNPQWNQTLEFPDDGSRLVLYVKDHNSLLPTQSLGECVVDYQRLPPNQMADKWIPLQGVKRGEIHIRITRKVPELHKRPSLDSAPSLSKLHQIPAQIKQMIIKFRDLIEDGNLQELSTCLSELESLEDIQKGYIVQLETEQMVLLSKIKELGVEISNSSSSSTFSKRSSSLR
ncbi:extended synaptotagmin-1-like [Neltuma alba]|uniref:extended synaptotagmin-1-like n=1 Tax=Neltuma alba TaxID=207710 RepID=UPI0010A3499B|nr:extended synaptotagmin-1-like [Prosopis alba]